MGREVLPIAPLEPPGALARYCDPLNCVVMSLVLLGFSRHSAMRAALLSYVRVWRLQAPANFFLHGRQFQSRFERRDMRVNKSASIFFQDAPMRAFLLPRLREGGAGKNGRKMGPPPRRRSIGVSSSQRSISRLATSARAPLSPPCIRYLSRRDILASESFRSLSSERRSVSRMCPMCNF